MAKHTPAPWGLEQDDYGEWSIEVPSSSHPFGVYQIVERVGGRIYVGEDDPYREQDANAYLIAAAPELLAALEGLLREATDDRLTLDMVVLAEAALAKARGES